MSTLLQVGLSNVAVASLLALVAVAVGRLGRRPALAHGLWVLVLLKLITPPLVVVPVSLPSVFTSEAAGISIDSPAAVDEARRTPFSRAKQEVAAAEVHRSSSPMNSISRGDAERGSMTDGDGAKWQAAIGERSSRTLGKKGILPHEHVGKKGILPHEAPRRFGRIDMASMFGIIWLGGSIVWFGLALVRIVRFGRLLGRAESAPADVDEETAALAERFGLRRRPLVGLMPGTVSPMLWALASRPRLLLPKQLLARLSGEQRLTLLAHELAHYGRGDHWVRYLEIAVFGLYWWCPLVWWARRELNQAEEECCDAWVVWALPNSGRAYARALVEALDFLANAQAGLPPAATGLGQIRSLRRRLTMIMRGTVPRTLSGLGLLSLIGVGLVALPLLPGLAQDRKGGEPRERDREKQEKLERLQNHLRELHENFERQRREFEQQVGKIREEMARLGFRDRRPDRPRPDVRKPVDRKRPDFRRPPYAPRPPGPPRDGFRPPRGPEPLVEHGPGDLPRRLQELERKVDMILRHLDRRGPGPRREPLRRPRREPPPRGAGGDPLGEGPGPGDGVGVPIGGAPLPSAQPSGAEK